MKKIFLMNIVFFTMILGVSYIPVEGGSSEHLLQGFGVVISFLTILWLVSIVLKDASIIDIFWGPSFIVLGSSLIMIMDKVYSERALMILFLVILWGMRLAIHLGIRNIGHGEDFRYVEWRKEGGSNYWWFSFFRVFSLQGALATLVGVSIYFGYLNENPLSYIEVFFGSTLFFIGIAWESISDIQLKKFRKDPKNKGKICKAGLWKYSRHPNYFGDLVVWTSIFTFSISSNNILIILGSSLSPLIMGMIFCYITGPILDQAMIKSRPEYKEYMKQSNSLFPKFK